VIQRIFPDVTLGAHLSEVDNTINDLGKKDVVNRIWRQDHTVWRPDSTEIADRLGWLTVTEMMAGQLQSLTEFAAEIRQAGFRYVVLLGMGGSSLGPETLRQAFGISKDYPELIVLDSTLPAVVETVAQAIDIRRTLFIVSSKSGTTVETMSLYRFFRSHAEQALGTGPAGRSFIAITDPATPLARLAGEAGFRKAFLNPSDIGGRYSVLSYFGLVPAVLAGIDIAALLDTAGRMREDCAASKALHENHGFRLGAIMGTLAQKGLDKLTFVTSPSIAGFGLWAEQLIAESTGKDGKGIIPVAGEPLLGPSNYGDDRLFVYLRLKQDDNSVTDAALEQIRTSGHPVVTLELRDRHALGAEFFRWEFATSVAGAVLGIHPFDQPNVQEAKEKTGRLLEEYRNSGRLPGIETGGSLKELLSGAGAGNYLAILAYVPQIPDTELAFLELRRKLMKCRIATTVGYGPRYLHSTGQLHKGGAPTGLFLQIALGHKRDFPVTGQPYSFGVLTDAEALGDFQALRSRGRKVIRIDAGAEVALAIRKLAGEVGTL